MALEHVTRAEALKSQRDDQAAEAAHRAALELNPHLADAHIGLAMLRLPEPHYLDWLARFHATRRPLVCLEIGVASGHRLRLPSPRHA